MTLLSTLASHNQSRDPITQDTELKTCLHPIAGVSARAFSTGLSRFPSSYFVSGPSGLQSLAQEMTNGLS